MRKPAHPGEILLDGFIEPHDIKIKDLAEHLGFSRETLSRVIHGKTPMTANLALALEDAGISTARLWLSLQSNYDVWALKQTREASTIRPFVFSEQRFV
ncbi:addiction module antidote protein, HigA family [Aggregatibacter actinomycetemcomitans]|uniref:Addiction module antidote protein, HigA family n=1 Tax=Aggregatibacter actinomycetemcomitans TaxID=714 RepID=A0A142FZI5_AGGAC|nr:HigA family addiction module antitoxin [Aggregatibacter actinomycetemcomitans]AFI86663.1 virulence protein [Aggregatibacter actinomycetemcomitans D7S-1]AMQ93815.1 virulence protein [Aggregatibacter actinomycetemcomitans]ANU81932.1 addiction module antidote protein, HigA family [Aggregatibacter actinomycetemcomitans]EKX93667.1 addiction module antidote protein HigA [Aggregatibacter actinomycetemcomitans Y4]KND83253.1 virulence protein [Aggregatibacter actinomycetemcomitans serotype a str. H5